MSANVLVTHGLDRTRSNCAGVRGKEFGVLTMIISFDDHKAEVSRVKTLAENIASMTKAGK